MIGRLNDGQIRQILQSQMVGRIGCHSKDKVYIVPLLMYIQMVISIVTPSRD